MMRWAWLWLMLGFGPIACNRPTAPSSSEPAFDPEPPWGSADLPGRTEVVAHADRLAVVGQRTAGAAGERLLARAAQLREAIWRLDARDADALEAVELHTLAARVESSKDCEHELRAVALGSELRVEPGRLYEGAYLIRETHRDLPRCVERANALLTTLGAYRAMPERLAELDRQARAARGEAAEEAPAANAAAARVVTPPQKIVAFAGVSRITQVERYPGKEAARVVVFMTAPASFTVGKLAAGNGAGPRLFVDIAGAQYAGQRQIEVGGLVEQVRVGAQEGATRVVLDLNAEVSEQVFYVPEPFRLVIDVSRNGAASESKMRTAGNDDRGIQRVVLDPGHGGHDPGATGVQGLREKDVVLDIAHRAAPLIARELGISTLLTRDVDTYVPLDERVARANAFAADLFISIHCNASETHGSRGVMTFVLDVAGDTGASRVAARENAASLAASAEFASAMSRVLDARVASESLHFAQLVQRASVAAIQPRYPDIRDGGVHRAGFYVLAGARMPAVLFESSFISHPTEELRLNSQEYRQKLADGLVNAIRAYREGL